MLQIIIEYLAWSEWSVAYNIWNKLLQEYLVHLTIHVRVPEFLTQWESSGLPGQNVYSCAMLDMNETN